MFYSIGMLRTLYISDINEYKLNLIGFFQAHSWGCFPSFCGQSLCHFSVSWSRTLWLTPLAQQHGIQDLLGLFCATIFSLKSHILKKRKWILHTFSSKLMHCKYCLLRFQRKFSRMVPSIHFKSKAILVSSVLSSAECNTCC